MNSILITGAGGQLGADFVRFLGESENHVALKSSDLDITDEKAVKATFQKHKPSVVINCAAYTAVDNAENDTEKAYAINELGVKNLAVACTEAGAKLVHFSTDYVFSGEQIDAEKFLLGYSEDAVTAPTGVYADSKEKGEKAILEMSGLDFLIIRVAWLNGYYGKNFVKTMVRLIKERDSLNVVNDQVGTPSFSENVVFNTLQLIRNQENGVYHIAATDSCSWFDISVAIRDWLGEKCDIKAIPSSMYPTPAKRPFYSGLSTTKIKEIDGIKLYPWKPQLNALMQELYT